MDRPNELFELAQKIADERPTFFDKKGPGIGDRDTSKFMEELKKRTKDKFGCNLAEKLICRDNKSTVDFYFREKETIVEVALSLHNSLSEFEKDIIKAILAVQVGGHPVKKLLFVSKPEAEKRHEAPLSRSIISWVKKDYGIEVEIKELTHLQSRKPSIVDLETTGLNPSSDRRFATSKDIQIEVAFR